MMGWLQDLYNYQMALQEIDNMRVDGKFIDTEGNRPEGQLVRRGPVLAPLPRCSDTSSGRPGPSVPPSTMLRTLLPPNGVERTHL